MINNQFVVIIIDDDKYWLKYLKELIDEIYNYNVETYVSFNKAEIRLSQKKEYHLVITDIYPSNYHSNKGEDTGLRFAKFVTTIKKVPVIVISGYANINNVREAFKDCHSFDFFDKKNMSRIEFQKSVKQAIEHYATTESKIFDIDKDNINIVQNITGKQIGNINLTVAPKQHININLSSLIDYLPENISLILNNYEDVIKNELNEIIHHIDDLIKDRQKIYTELMKEITKIAKSNKLANEYLTYLIANKSLMNNKLELTIFLIPGILGLKANVDLDNFLDKIYNKYDLATFKIYEKLSKIYYNFKEKLKRII